MCPAYFTSALFRQTAPFTQGSLDITNFFDKQMPTKKRRMENSMRLKIHSFQTVFFFHGFAIIVRKSTDVTAAPTAMAATICTASSP